MNKPGRNRRGSLDQATIVATAIDLADADGVEKLTMRNLADKLGYKVMALYNHVGNKDELSGLMVDAVVAVALDPSVGSTDTDTDTGTGTEIESKPESPLAAVRSIALSVRAVLVAHPWAAELWLRQMPGPARTQIMENLLSALAATDLSPEIAHHGFHAVTNHVIGYTLQESGMNAGLDSRDVDDVEQVAHDFMGQLDSERFAHTITHVRQHLDGETSSSFEFVLDLILDGLVRAGEKGH